MQYVRHSTAADPDSLEAMSDKDLKAKLLSLKKWEKLDIKQIAAEQEVLFIDQHYCNDNLKACEVDEDEGFRDENFKLKPQEIIKKNDSKRFTLKEAEREWGETKEQERFRLENNKIALQEIQNKIERRKYLEMTKDIKYNDPEDDADFKVKQEFRFTVAFGFGFITLMFLAFACGYLLGKKVFNLNETNSLILSLIMGMGTIILETILFVIRMEKMDAQSRVKEQRSNSNKRD